MSGAELTSDIIRATLLALIYFIITTLILIFI